MLKRAKTQGIHYHDNITSSLDQMTTLFCTSKQIQICTEKLSSTHSPNLLSQDSVVLQLHQPFY